MSEGLTYTEAKKIVKAWRQDFACNVSEEYIINAFLDDAIVIKKLRAELAAMTARAEAAERLLENLTPGGSEFHANPTRCVEWVRERLQGVAAQVEKRKAAEEQLAAVDEYGSYCIVAWWKSINNPNIAPMPFAKWYAQERQEVQP